VQAAREGRAVKVAKFQWAASGRATTLGRSDGVRSCSRIRSQVASSASHQPGRGGGGELIAEGALAIETAWRAEDLALTITPIHAVRVAHEAAEGLFR